MTPKSEREYRRALRLQPQLAGRLAIVGDPLLDDLIEKDRDREAIRRQLGIAPERKTVGLMSSWGYSSRLRVWLMELYEKAKELPPELQFIFFAHLNSS